MFASIKKKRIEKYTEKLVSDTQFGFRTKRGTTQAILIIRRLIDLGERTQKDEGRNIRMVFLDWGKAIDKVDQESIFETLSLFRRSDKYC